MIDLISIYALMLCKKVIEMRIGCDLLRMQYLGYLAKINLHFAFEAYRPKLGKSLKKKMKGQSQQQKVFWLGVCTENASFRRHFCDLKPF